MAQNSKIEWTGETWNPLVGCTIISPGCTNCYAMREAHRQQRCAAGLSRETHYTGTTKLVKDKPVWTGHVFRAPDHILTAPLRWRKPKLIFVNSMSDLFHEDVPDAWIDQVFAVMALAPQHTFQVLTKRSRRMREYLTNERRPHQVARAAVDLFRHRKLPSRMPLDDRWPVKSIGDIDLPDDITLQTWPLPNVWLGVSVEDQTRADERIPDLLATPAAVRWISAEPLLGPVDLRRWMGDAGGAIYDAAGGQEDYIEPTAPGLDWVVVGGESGPGARPMHPDWARSLRDQCAAADVPFFFKQWGDLLPFGQSGFTAWHAQTGRSGNISKASGLWWGNASFNDGAGGPTTKTIGPVETQLIGNAGLQVVRLGKKAAGRLLDGAEHNAMPEAAR